MIRFYATGKRAFHQDKICSFWTFLIFWHKITLQIYLLTLVHFV